MVGSKPTALPLGYTPKAVKARIVNLSLTEYAIFCALGEINLASDATDRTIQGLHQRRWSNVFSYRLFHHL